MRLDALVAQADLPAAGAPALRMLGDATGAEVTAITMDSGAVSKGTLYCCVRGQRFDGHDFAPAAVAEGAVALLCQRPLDLPVAQVVVGDVRAAAAPLASVVYGRPSEALMVLGVTGTNGKTTTTYLLESIFEAAGLPGATIGTLSGARTTPEAPVVQAMLARFRAEGRVAVAMEVSSHALVQHRVDAVCFAAAVFTNLSQDHLDYHATMEDYFEAKARLFAPGRAAVAVVNGDDPWGRRLLDRLASTAAGTTRVVPFSLDDAERLEIGATGSRFRWRGQDVALQLGGRFNVRNALAAATAAEAVGIDRPSIVAGVERLASVRGRFEPVRAGQPFTVLVDYAHTPEGLEEALRGAREMTSRAGRVIVVFGAGGDRDQAKRPLMGAAATAGADLAVLTSDNPRSEDPAAIIAQVAEGASGGGELRVEPDRGRAISVALATARPADVVVLAGKGHETVQERQGSSIPFDDAEVARRALAELCRQRGGW
jgi:UDP-N-acetylmuramoyl-L-alanyl-D-glutamate--2,6-diaminopimelate ligase